MPLERWRAAHAAAHQPRDDTLEVSGQRGLARGHGRLGLALRLDDTDRTAPVVEQVEDVALAELDADRTPRATSRLQTLAIPIDPAIGHGQRHTAVGPPAHLLERRPHDAHEMAAVLATEIGFEIAAVFREVWHRATDDPLRSL